MDLAGIASSERGIQRVEYSLNGSAWRPIALNPAASNSAAFTTTLDELRGLTAGKNTILVRAIDSDGLASRILTRQITVRQFARLTVGIQGAGTVSRDFLGFSRREVGKLYTVSAAPARGQIFSGWQIDGFILSSERAFSFSMYKGLKLTAVFIANPYPAVAGRYVAAIGRDQDLNSARGQLEFDLGRLGSFTGSLRIAGKTYPFSGTFDSFGFYYVALEGGGIIIDGQPRGLRLHPGFNSLNLSIALNFETGVVATSISRFDDADGFTTDAVLQRISWKADSRPCPIAGRWDVTVPELAGPRIAPAGTGSAKLFINANGRARLRGTLADGAAWSAVSAVADNLALPLYKPLYGKLGSISGELQFTLQDGSGDFFWIKPDLDTGEGFAEHVNVEAVPHPTP